TNRIWDFGDGTIASTSATSFTHVYFNASTNSVTLSVSGPVGSNSLFQANYITATNLPPQLTIQNASLAFDPLVIGQSDGQSFVIVNTGGLDIHGSVSTTPPFDIPDGGFILSPGQTGLVQVVFSPISAGSFSNAAVFITDGGNSTNTITGSAV